MLTFLYCVNENPKAREWLAYSITSLKRYLGRKFPISIFVASDVPYQNDGVRWIDARPYITRYQLDKITQIRKEGRIPSPLQVFRLAAPLVEELKNIDRLIYLDIDTEVVNDGLEHLLEEDFDADVLALEEHSKHGNDSSRIMLESSELRSLMSPNTIERLSNGGYFNSGVLVMNLKRIRRVHPNWGHMLPKYIDMAIKHHRCVVDQDIANVIFDAKPFPPRFNTMPDTDAAMEKADPVIVHYANIAKYRQSNYPPHMEHWEIKRKFLVDAVFAVCFTGNKRRYERLLEEANRVGIQDLTPIWMFPSPYRRFVLDKIPHVPLLENEGCWGATIGHYQAIKTAYELGHSNCLIVEDDCRFLKDINQIRSTLSMAPIDYDFLFLDSVWGSGRKETVNGWCRCAETESTACYVISRRAMKYLIDMYESPVSGKYPNPMMRASDHWAKEIGYDGTKLKIYCANPNLAIQVRCPGKANCGESVFDWYKSIGLEVELYEEF